MQKENPLFTIVVPCYDPGEKLRETVDSVLRQRSTAFGCELIIVDGGSSDQSTRDILDSLARSAQAHIVSEPDRGVYDAINKGIRLGSGKYFNFLGAGDTLADDALKTVGELIANDEPMIVYGNVYLQKSLRTAGSPFTVADFRRKRNVYHQAMFFHRRVFQILGDYDLRYPTRSDNVFNMRLWANSALSKRYVDRTLAQYEEGGISDTRRDDAFEQDFGKLVRRLYGLRHYALYCLASIKYRAVARRKP